MYKFEIYHDGGFLMDSSDPVYDMVYETYEEAEKLHHEEYPRRRIIDRNEKK